MYVPPANPVDDGVSVYDRDRVEDVEFKQGDFTIVHNAVQVFGENNRPRDIFNIHRGKKRPVRDPMELLLPAGVNPHEPVLHLAKACIDVTRGYGLSSVIAVDTDKASRFERATDSAIDKMTRQQRAGLLGFAFVVIRHEDRSDTSHEDRRTYMLRELIDMIDGGGDDVQPETVATEVSEDEANRLARVERLTKTVRELNVPSMHLLTMESMEPAPKFQDGPADYGMDSGTRLY
jgi:hypothetical protein